MEIEHFSHTHPLKPLHHQNGTVCSGCTKRIYRPDIVYGCTQCNFYLHKSCAEWPEEINHPFHQHPLSLIPDSPYTTMSCHACWDYFNGTRCFTFSCKKEYCNFNLDPKCALMKPTLISPVHEHPLAYFKMVGASNCKVCTVPCKDSVLCCVPCRLSVHVGCVARLPQTSKVESHRHDLHLTESLHESFLEFYCDACEELRTPNEPIYYCGECDFVAHIYCAIPESQIIINTVEAFTERSRTAVDPALAEVNEEIATFRAELDALTTRLEEVNIKLGELEKKRYNFLQKRHQRGD